MKLFNLILFCAVSTLQIAVMASGNGGAYGGSETADVSVIQTSESQMLSASQIKETILTCAGNHSDNNLFQKVFGPIYKNDNGVQISKEIGGGIQFGDTKIWIVFSTYAFKKNSEKKYEQVSSLRIDLNGFGTLDAYESPEAKCLPYPTDRCIEIRQYKSHNMPIIRFKEALDIPTVDPVTGDIIKTEKYLKGVTVEYNDSLPPESTLYNEQSDKPTLLRFPSREFAECLRARLSHL